MAQNAENIITHLITNQNHSAKSELLKRVSEIESHPNFRNITDVKIIKDYIAKVNNQGEEAPLFQTKKTYAKSEDWKGLPYFLRPSALFPGHYIISGLYYSFGVQLVNINADITSKNANAYISLENFEVLFKPVENGFVPCRATQKEVVPIGGTTYPTLKALLDVMSKLDFELIVSQRTKEDEHTKTLAGLISEKTTLQDYLKLHLKNRFGYIEQPGFIIVPKQNWINEISAKKSEQPKTETKAKAESQKPKTKNKGESQIPDLDNIPDWLSSVAENFKTPQGTVNMYDVSMDEPMGFEIDMIKTIGRAVIIPNHEYLNVVYNASKLDEQTLNNKLDALQDDMNITKQVFTTYFERYFKPSCLNYMNSLRSQQEIENFTKKYTSILDTVQKEQDANFCACCDDAIIEKSKPAIDKKFSKEELKAMEDAVKSALQEFRKQKQTFKNYLQKNRKGLFEFLVKLNKTINAKNTAKTNAEVMKRINGSMRDIIHAENIAATKELEWSDLANEVTTTLVPYYLHAKMACDIRTHYLKLNQEYKDALQSSGVVHNHIHVPYKGILSKFNEESKQKYDREMQKKAGQNKAADSNKSAVPNKAAEPVKTADSNKSAVPSKTADSGKRTIKFEIVKDQSSKTPSASAVNVPGRKDAKDIGAILEKTKKDLNAKIDSTLSELLDSALNDLASKFEAQNAPSKEELEGTDKTFTISMELYKQNKALIDSLVEQSKLGAAKAKSSLTQ